MHTPDADGPTLNFDLAFDDALFRKEARTNPPDSERVTLKAQVAHMLDALFAHDPDRWVLLQGTRDDDVWDTKPAITNDFIEKMHFLFADVVMRDNEYDVARDTYTFHDTFRHVHIPRHALRKACRGMCTRSLRVSAQSVSRNVYVHRHA